MSAEVGKRHLVSVLVIGALTVSVVTVAGGGRLAAGAEAAKKKPPSQAAVAVKLAKQVTGARTPAARYKALLAVMKALHVGVYTAAGKPVVRGAERNARDVFLYDFELRIGAAALGAKRTSDLTAAASSLFRLGVGKSGAALGPGEVRQVLVGAVQAARTRPRRKAALPALLLRELGLRGAPRYDLATAAVEAIRLDAVQELLVLADAASGRRTSASRRTAAASAGCSNITGDRKTDEILGQIRWPGTPAELDKLHDQIVSKGIVLEDLTPGAKETHYFPAGHAENAGKQLSFAVRAVMTVDVPKAIRCGPLAGRNVPAKGPVEGVPITWADSGLTTTRSAARVPLESLGRVFPDRQTGPDGVAVAFFEPNTELYRGFGGESVASGEVAMAVTSGEAFRSWPIRVRRHQPQGFKFSGLKFRADLSDSSDAFVEYTVVHARKCGEDPFGQANGGRWAVILHEHFHYAPAPDYDGPRSGYWIPGKGIVVENSSGVRDTELAGGLVFVLEEVGSGLQARAIIDPKAPFDIWMVSVSKAPITEDVDKGAFPYSCAEVGY